MKSTATRRFWQCYSALPSSIQQFAQKNYALWCENPHHPSLHFKLLHGSARRFSVRIGDHYRAIGHETVSGVEWVWIGSHEEYNKLLKR